MAVIWYAIGIYMVGVAVVLYLRPRVMFRDDGMWKEFGLSANQEKQTIFPFWMFALIWAILSYALANLVSMFFASVVLKSADTANVNGSFMQPISTHPNANVPQVMPPPPTVAPPPPINMTMATNMPVAQKVPGYYILDPYANPAHPRYIYYGPDPPGSI